TRHRHGAGLQQVTDAFPHFTAGTRSPGFRSLTIRLLGRRAALVSRQALYVRSVLLLDSRVDLVRARGEADRASRLGGGTILIPWLTCYSGTRILRARGARNVRVRCLRQRRWT